MPCSTRERLGQQCDRWVQNPYEWTIDTNQSMITAPDSIESEAAKTCVALAVPTDSCSERLLIASL